MLALLADLHIWNHARFPGAVTNGLNNRCVEGLDTLERALRFAVEQGARGVILAGDVYDGDRPPPAVQSAVMSLLEECGLPIAAIQGNHDTHSDMPGDNALATLRHVPNVTVYEKATYIGGWNTTVVPFSSKQTGNVAGYLRSVLPKGNGTSYLVGHFGIIHTATPWFLAKTGNCIAEKDLVDLCAALGYRHAFAGDWHTPYYGERATQIGALAPVNFTDGENCGGVLFCYEDCAEDEPSDPARVSPWVIPGPRFITVTSVDDLTPREDSTQEYVRVLADSVSGVELAALAKRYWPGAHVSVEPADEETQVTPEEMERHWSSDAVQEATVDWVHSTVPEAYRDDVVGYMLKHIQQAMV